MHVQGLEIPFCDMSIDGHIEFLLPNLLPVVSSWRWFLASSSDQLLAACGWPVLHLAAEDGQQQRRCLLGRHQRYAADVALPQQEMVASVTQSLTLRERGSALACFLNCCILPHAR
jgi:hypothetical protein